MKYLVILAVAGSSSVSSGAVTYLSQNRFSKTVTHGQWIHVTQPGDGFVFEPGDIVTKQAASDFGLFTTLQQNSSLTTGGITARGIVAGFGGFDPHFYVPSANGPGVWIVPGVPSADVYTTFEVTFLIDEPTLFNFSAHWSLGLIAGGMYGDVQTAEIALIGPEISVATIYVPTGDVFNEGSINEMGTLQPGEYRLTASFSWTGLLIGGGPAQPIDYDINLHFAPTPTTLAVLVPAMAVTGRRRRAASRSFHRPYQNCQ